MPARNRFYELEALEREGKAARNGTISTFRALTPLTPYDFTLLALRAIDARWRVVSKALNNSKASYSRTDPARADRLCDGLARLQLPALELS